MAEVTGVSNTVRVLLTAAAFVVVVAGDARGPRPSSCRSCAL